MIITPIVHPALKVPLAGMTTEQQLAWLDIVAKCEPSIELRLEHLTWLATAARHLAAYRSSDHSALEVVRLYLGDVGLDERLELIDETVN